MPVFVEESDTLVAIQLRGVDLQKIAGETSSNFIAIFHTPAQQRYDQAQQLSITMEQGPSGFTAAYLPAGFKIQQVGLSYYGCFIISTLAVLMLDFIDVLQVAKTQDEGR